MEALFCFLQSQGEFEETLALQQQPLETNRKLNNKGGIAATLWDLARIEFDQGRPQEAALKVNEAYQLVDRMGRLEGIAAIGVVHGQFLVAAGKPEEGLAVLRRSEAGFRKLGQGGSADQVAQMIDRIEAGLKDGGS